MAQGQQKGGKTTRRNALAHPDNRRALSAVDMMYKAGKNYSQIADHLNCTGFQTVRGGTFQAIQVKRLLKRHGSTTSD